MLLDRTKDPSWAILVDAVPSGGLNLRIWQQNRFAELGYSLARRHWNRGYGSEAAGAVIDAAFSTIPELIRVRAFTDARNAASQRVMAKIGMSKEGVLRQNRVERDVLMDEAWWGILRAEWEAGSQD